MKVAAKFKNQPQAKLAEIATGLADENLRLRKQLRAVLSAEEYQQVVLKLEAQQHREREEVEAQSGPPKPRPPQKGHGPTKQTELEEEERTYELDDADKTCPKCGGNLIEWDRQFETSELIDIVEHPKGTSFRARAIIKAKVKRQKYRCDCAGCGHIDTALGPLKTITGGRYSLEFAIEVASQKYLDHMPLERIARQMERQGLKVKSQTLWDQAEALAMLLEQNWEALRRYILRAAVVGLDPTGWPRLMKRKVSNKKSKPWQMWCLTSVDAVYHMLGAQRPNALGVRSAKTRKPKRVSRFWATLMASSFATKHRRITQPRVQVLGRWRGAGLMCIENSGRRATIFRPSANASWR